jgi:hypothetical protein
MESERGVVEAVSSMDVGALADEIIRLNVGGTYFSTRKAHLLQSPFFEGLFRFQDKERSSDGSFFVDRNPKVFEVILELFRTGVLFWHDEIQLRAILIEADYFLISDKARTQKENERRKGRKKFFLTVLN